ncbi:HAMP domain-containing sensor histidine kinase [Paenibacillus sp. y28]|uniref:HAMP domain-containing sensor histidine kinase n=1 Tax=Paenibacillus sp. y28 TaxID=3129110 RepID=UPI0030172104
MGYRFGFGLLPKLRIKWRLVLWSALMLIVLYTICTFIQYMVIHQWIMKQEETGMRKDVVELLQYFQDKNEELDEAGIRRSHNFLAQFIQKSQLIRILDSQGNPILTVSNDLPENCIHPEVSSGMQLYSTWYEDEHIMVARSPLITSHYQGTLEIVHSLEAFDELNGIIVLMMTAGGMVAIVLSLAGGFVITNQLLKPLQALAETIKNVKQKGLHERVAVAGERDELSHLANLFNDMMTQLEASFVSQKQFVENASHELRTPLSIIQGHLSLLHRWGKRDPAILEQSLTASLHEIHRLKTIVDELLQLTRAESEHDPQNMKPELLRPIVEQTVEQFAFLHHKFEFKLDLDALTDVEVCIAANHLKQILLILLDNAVKYSAQDKVVFVNGRVLEDENKVQVEVKDTGIGIPEEDLPYVFDRFYRVDKARSRERGGSGLGLSIAKQLVQRYEGSIYMMSAENKGTTVAFVFRMAREEAKRAGQE